MNFIDLFSRLAHHRQGTLLSLLYKGGWVMVPILLLSIGTTYVLIERVLTLYATTRSPRKQLKKLRRLLALPEATCTLQMQSRRHIVFRAAQAYFEAGLSQDASAALERAAQRSIYKLEHKLAFLAAAANAAPMLGFLGTVLGMMQSFKIIAQEAGPVGPQGLSAGIYEAMVTTAAGLMVGVVASSGYNYLSSRIQRTALEIEEIAEDIKRCIAEARSDSTGEPV